MLTKEQIETYWDWHECNCKFAFDSPTSFEVCKQARQAVDLAAENERLKAKLDAVRKWASNPVRIDDFGYQMAQESVLAIIDGEEKYHAD